MKPSPEFKKDYDKLDKVMGVAGVVIFACFLLSWANTFYTVFATDDWKATPRPSVEKSKALWGETETTRRLSERGGIVVETEYDLKRLVDKVEEGSASEGQKAALSRFIGENPHLWEVWSEENRLGEYDH